MSQVLVTIPGTEIELPLSQALALWRLMDDLKGSTWHLAECGCCVCLHPEGDTSRGWLIGADGKSEYREHEGAPSPTAT